MSEVYGDNWTDDENDDTTNVEIVVQEKKEISNNPKHFNLEQFQKKNK